MKHDKLVDDAKRDPTRIYSNPADVLRDRRLGDLDRLEILRSWEREARAQAGDAQLLQGVIEALQEAERRLPEAQNRD